MRKCQQARFQPRGSRRLQCGRIYKDAEIRRTHRFCVRRPWLQCGRIYKDAEIRKKGLYQGYVHRRFNVAASIKMRKSCCSGAGAKRGAPLQCGRIYKDAEIRSRPIRQRPRMRSFNVAASIKMRKSIVGSFGSLQSMSASMWPHL